MSLMFVVNASAITLVVSMVEGTRFLDVFRLPLAINVLHWLGNMALGILAAISWAIQPASLILMLAPVSLAYLTYRRWVTSVFERNQALDLYEAGRTLDGPIASGRTSATSSACSRSCSPPIASSWSSSRTARSPSTRATGSAI